MVDARSTVEGGWGVGGLVGWCGGVIRAPAERMPKVRGRAQGGAIHHHVPCRFFRLQNRFRRFAIKQAKLMACLIANLKLSHHGYCGQVMHKLFLCTQTWHKTHRHPIHPVEDTLNRHVPRAFPKRLGQFFYNLACTCTEIRVCALVHYSNPR